MDQLTKKQAETLFLIRKFLGEKGYPPTVRELVSLTGRKSTAGVQKLLNTLEKKGHIKKAPGRSRGIVPLGGVQSFWAPLVGSVVAGSPALSEEHSDGYHALDGSAVPVPEGSFLLRVRGDSMIGDHIQDGDLILVSPQARAEDGAIVVAMVDGETTVKRLYRRGDGIQLVPSHPTMEPLSIRQDAQLRIIGKVVAVLRFLEPAFSLAPAPEMHQES
ncbi:MAG: transcriptional repressor LexA [Desulfobacterales bacterium]|nr:transcriptional repressor LexA [Desulfobacterales bacterium]